MNIWEKLMPALIGFIGVIVGAIISGLYLKWVYNKERVDAKIRSAAILSSILDNYAAECCVYLGNTGREIQDSEAIDGRSYFLPDAPSFPEFVDFSSLELESASQALLLTGQTQLEQFAIMAIEQDRENDWGKRIKKRIAVHGLKYLELAEKIRRKNAIPNPNPDQLGWDYKSVLERAAKTKE